MKRVICKSGLHGWQAKLQENYGDFESFRAYSEMYGLHCRLGFATARACWDSNPTVQGSTDPRDFRKVKP